MDKDEWSDRFAEEMQRLGVTFDLLALRALGTEIWGPGITLSPGRSR